MPDIEGDANVDDFMVRGGGGGDDCSGKFPKGSLYLKSIRLHSDHIVIIWTIHTLIVLVLPLTSLQEGS